MSHDVVHEAKWWLIPARPKSCCSDCCSQIPAETEAAFCHELAEVLCQVCTDRRGITPQPSRRLLKQHARAAVDRDMLVVACPRIGCEMPAGERCVDRSGSYKPTPHAARQRLAIRQSLRPKLTIVRNEAS